MSDLLPYGIYYNLPDEAYDSDPGLNNSGIKVLAESRRAFWEQSPFNKARRQRARSDELESGIQYHRLLLQPERFNELYYVAGRERFAEGKRAIKDADYEAMLASKRVIQRHPKAEILLNKKFGYPEVTVIWQDQLTGVRCKARHDFFCWEWTVDYKTIYSIARHAVAHQMKKYGYFQQDAFYMESRREIRKMIDAGKASFWGDWRDSFRDEFMNAESDNFIFAFQSKSEPYSVRLVELNSEYRDYGTTLFREGINTFHDCLTKHGTETPWEETDNEIEELDMRYGFSQY